MVLRSNSQLLAWISAPAGHSDFAPPASIMLAKAMQSIDRTTMGLRQYRPVSAVPPIATNSTYSETASRRSDRNSIKCLVMAASDCAHITQ